MTESSTARTRPALVLGLAFVIGTLVFFIVFQLMRSFGPGAHEPLTPVAQRKEAGQLSAVVLMPGTLGNAASAATAPADAPGTWSLADHRGKVVLVNYFATWCGPCVAETPDLVAVAEEYASKGVVTVALSMDRDDDRVGGESSRRKALDRYVASHKVSYPILVPPEDSMLWKLEFPIPQTFLYDRQGRRALHITGMVDAKGLRRSLDELLAER